MKISFKYKVREMAGQHVVIMSGNLSGGGMTRIISLNETSLYLWNRFYEQEFDVTAVASALVEEYGINMNDAAADAKTWCSKLDECGLLER